MSICAPKSFGSKFLKGGYSYWPLWWYGQKSKLHDMSGHSVDLTPGGAYFDGQGYYFDGSDDYLVDDGGRKVLHEPTTGSWHSVYLTEGEVPVEGSVRGSGTRLRFNYSGATPKITGKIVLRPEYCPNLTHLDMYKNDVSLFDVRGLPSLERVNIPTNNTYTLKLRGTSLLKELYCYSNHISILDLSTSPLLKKVYVHYNSMDQDMVDTILCVLDSHGQDDGILCINGNAAPSATGVACRDNLVARGWTVQTS